MTAHRATLDTGYVKRRRVFEGPLPRWAVVILLGLCAYLGQSFGNSILGRLDELSRSVGTMNVSLAVVTTQVGEYGRRLEALESWRRHPPPGQ